MSTTAVAFGNKCGHDPNNPRFYEPPAAGRTLPDVLEIAKRNLVNFYYFSSERLQQLRLLRGTVSSRQYRSESREAISAVLGAILHHTDLKTFLVGRYDSKTGQVTPIKIETIANYAKIGLKRCKRVIQLLNQCGYLELRRRSSFDSNNHSYIGLSSVKRVTIPLFFHLGISRLKLDKAITYAKNQAKKLEKKKIEHSKEEEWLYPARLKLKKKGPTKAKENSTLDQKFKPHEPIPLNEDVRKRLSELIMALRLAEPDKPAIIHARQARESLGLSTNFPTGGLFFE